jgi:hypothetical protein
MDKFTRLLLPLFLIMMVQAVGQSANTADMADTMRSNGKIYVVVAVIITLFIGFTIYLISLDRKISKLEKEAGKP